MKCTSVRLAVCVALANLLQPGLAPAQVLMGNGTYSQNFNSLATSGNANAWTDNLTLPGWYASRSVSPNEMTAYRADSRTSYAGALYSYGQSGSNERSLGSIASSATGRLAYGVRLLNNTDVPQTAFKISYTGKQWRVASANVQRLSFSYRIGISLTNSDAADSQNWTPAPALDFSSPNTSPTQALNGDDPANQVAFMDVLLDGVVVEPGQELFLRWSDPDDIGSDDALALDDLTVSFAPARTNQPPAAETGFTILTYNTKGNGSEDWSTNSPQVQAIGRELMYLNPDIIALNEIPYTNTYQMANWVKAFLPGYYLATNSATDGYIRNAIASRFPILRSKSWLHSSNLDPYGYTNSNFTRDLFEAVIAVPDFPQPLHVFCVHLKSGQDSNSSAKRAAEAGAISNFFATGYLTTNALQPYLVCGDMNEDIARPPSSDPESIQRLISAPTGLRLTTPLNPFTGSELTYSIESPPPYRRYDYILPCGLLFSNRTSSQVFRTDLLNPVPAGLNGDDDATASDHLPVIMTFANPYAKPFDLTSLIRTSQTISLTWDSVAGQFYDVETSSNLLNWKPLASGLMATNANFSFSTNMSYSAQFFRVRQE